MRERWRERDGEREREMESDRESKTGFDAYIFVDSIICSKALR